MFMKKLREINYYKLAWILLFVGVSVVVLLCFSSGISGNDFWWHIKVGEYVCNNKTVPTTDIFSWIGMEKGIPWTAHEWLADVIFYLIYDLAGSKGIFVFSLLMAFIMEFLLWKQVKSNASKNILVSGLFFGLFAVLTSLFFYGRPHIFSYFFLFFELKILYDFWENNESKKIWFIPLISILWSNIHGGSSNLSYILCFLFLFVGIINLNLGRIQSTRLSKKALLKLGAVFIATIAGIFVNPIGYKVFIYPYVNLSDSLSMNVISEWAAPDAKIVGNLVLYFLPIVVMSIGIIAENVKIRLVDLGIMILFLFLFFRSARFIVLWYIAAAFYAFRYISECKVKPIEKAFEKVAVWICLGLMVVPFGMSIKNYLDTSNNNQLISTVMLDEAIDAVKSSNPKRIYNDYNVGEALIYNNVPVFFDARADLYAQENIMADGVSLMFLEQANPVSKTKHVDVDAITAKYDFDYILILKSRPLYSYLMANPDKYIVQYEDQDICYFRIVGEN